MKGFRKFVLRGNVVDLAIAVVIGTAFGALITAFVGSFITPLIAAIGGKRDFSQLLFTVNKSEFKYGLFINAVIAFVIIAAAIYFFVVIPVGKLMEHYKPTADETKNCPECLSAIPVAARKCAFCASPQVPAQPTATVNS